MKSRTWLRYALGAAMASCLGAGGLIAGCGGDDTTNNPTTDGGSDGDNTDGNTTADTGPGDTGTTDGTTEAGPPNAKLIVVHASPNVPAVRVCFGVGPGNGTVTNAFAALPDTAPASLPYPGIFPGTGGVFPDVGLDLSPLALTPYAILASVIAGDTKAGSDGGKERTCDKLIGTDGKGKAGAGGGALTLGTDYVQLPNLPAGTFAKGKTLLIAITGCLPGAANGGSTDKCGSDWTVANGNVGVKILSLDKAAAPGATGMGIQVAHLSSPLENTAVFSAGAGIYPYITLPAPADGGTDSGDGGDGGDAAPPAPPKVWLGGPDKYGSLSPAAAQIVTGVDPTTAKFGFSVTDKGAPAGALPLTQIQLLTIGSPTPADYFKNGGVYTFVVVGDPAEPSTTDAGTPNLKTLHFLGFPNDPAVPSL